uniref:Uncharacterized protein n=1 Tax=Arundo donax TaxID=35708 RepID=A0A0A9EGF9_ARUDO
MLSNHDPSNNSLFRKHRLFKRCMVSILTAASKLFGSAWSKLSSFVNRW